MPIFECIDCAIRLLSGTQPLYLSPLDPSPLVPDNTFPATDVSDIGDSIRSKNRGFGVDAIR